jgi:hypothetical protein
MTYLQPAIASMKLPETVRSAANSFKRSAAPGSAVRCPTALRLFGSLHVACTVYPRSSSCCTMWPANDAEVPFVEHVTSCVTSTYVGAQLGCCCHICYGVAKTGLDVRKGCHGEGIPRTAPIESDRWPDMENPLGNV